MAVELVVGEVVALVAVELDIMFCGETVSRLLAIVEKKSSA